MNLLKILMFLWTLLILQACQNVEKKESKLNGSSEITVRSELRNLSPSLIHCATSNNQGNGIIPNIVFLDFWIEPSGSVEEVFIQGLDTVPDLKKCLVRTVKNHQFSHLDSNQAFWMRAPIDLNQNKLFNLGQ